MVDTKREDDWLLFFEGIQLILILLLFLILLYFSFAKIQFMGIGLTIIIFITSYTISYLAYFIIWFFTFGWKWWLKLTVKGLRSNDGFIETISRYKILKKF